MNKASVSVWHVKIRNSVVTSTMSQSSSTTSLLALFRLSFQRSLQYKQLFLGKLCVVVPGDSISLQLLCCF